MMMEKVLSRSIRVMFAGGMALGMQVALAQQAADNAPIQKVEITGSRIPSINVDGASPVTMISEKDIKIDGSKNTEDLVNNLPQAFADQGSNISNGSTGTATVSLRGLGCDRTLVLVDGKRMPMGSALNTCADINEVPAALIKRVDVLTGGAAAVYGAGAVAGVVNFILKDNFEGVQVEANMSGFNHKQHNPAGVDTALSNHNYPAPGNVGLDGQSQEASILMGSNFADNKGNATVFFNYKHDRPILQATRDFSACALGSGETGFSCAGSSTSANGRFIAPSGTSYTVGDANGTAIPYKGSRDAFNYAPYNYFQRSGDSYNANAQAHYDINDKVRVYQDFSFHTYTTDAQIAPSGIFLGDPNHIIIHGDNPLLSQSWKDALGLVNPTDTADLSGVIGRRNVEGGNRFQRITDTSYREVLGVKGDVSNWSYDVYAQFAKVDHSDSQNNYFSVSKINKAMDVVTGPDGTPMCRSAVDGSDPKCVPYNIWTQGGVTQAALDYLYTPGLSSGYTQQNIYGGSLSSTFDNVKLPTAKDGLGVAFGVERRVEKLVFNPDNEVATGDLAGTGGTGTPAVQGDYDVKEIFGEVNVPLAQNLPMVKSLNFDGTYRYSDYSTGKKTNTFGLGLDWNVNQAWRARGSYQRAVRAPTIFDLYNPQTVGLGNLTTDPCAGATPQYTQAQCANTGVAAAQYGKLPDNPAGQYNSLLGGNPNVNPEKADTYTLGVVFNPIKALTVSLDVFQIKIKDYIQAGIDPNTAMSQCLETGNPLFCSQIHRDANGSLWLSPAGYVLQTTTNIGSQSTSGLDISGAYRYTMGSLGSLDFVLNGTYLKSLKTQAIPGINNGDDTFDCAGYYGATCGTPNPTWRHKFRTTWTTPWDMEVAATWRHFSSVKDDALNPSQILAGDVSPIEAKFGARDYFDLYASYTLYKNITIAGGINNLFDRDPPLGSSAVLPGIVGNGNTFPQVYDALGRKIYLNLTAKF